MTNTKRMNIIKVLFLIINSVVVIGIGIFIYFTTRKICMEDHAREFLAQVKAIPNYPFSMCVFLFVLLSILILDMIIREKKKEGSVITVTLCLDFVCSLLIVFILDFNYNGVLLLVFSNVIVYVGNRRIKFLLVGVAMISYLVADYDLLSVSSNLFSIRDYIQYYSTTNQQIAFSIFNVFISMNILIFILYCINIINEQDNTIKEVNEWSKQLQDANERLKEYNRMTEKMVETRERNRMAREIHDTLGHVLTGVSAGVDACIALVDIDIEQTKKQLETIACAVRGGIKEVRRSVSELRADALEHFQLEDAIKNMVTEINLLSGVEVFFDSKVDSLKFNEDEENVVYRIIQEGITNALRHGHATKVWIDIEKTGEILHLKIQDNGCGCKEVKKGFGTKHMKERVRMLGGDVNFYGEDGFLIDAKIPIRWGEKE